MSTIGATAILCSMFINELDGKCSNEQVAGIAERLDGDTARREIFGSHYYKISMQDARDSNVSTESGAAPLGICECIGSCALCAAASTRASLEEYSMKPDAELLDHINHKSGELLDFLDSDLPAFAIEDQLPSRAPRSISLQLNSSILRHRRTQSSTDT